MCRDTTAVFVFSSPSVDLIFGLVLSRALLVIVLQCSTNYNATQTWVLSMSVHNFNHSQYLTHWFRNENEGEHSWNVCCHLTLQHRTMLSTVCQCARRWLFKSETCTICSWILDQSKHHFPSTLLALLSEDVGFVASEQPKSSVLQRLLSSLLWQQLCLIFDCFPSVQVFLQHLSPLLSLPTFAALWLTILDFMDKYMHAGSSDLLVSVNTNILYCNVFIANRYSRLVDVHVDQCSPPRMWWNSKAVKCCRIRIKNNPGMIWQIDSCMFIHIRWKYNWST